MNQEDRIYNFYKELYKDEFIATHDFQKYRFGSEEFFALASTLRSRAGRDITCSFNIHDEEPDEVELVMQFLNRSSLEQIRVVAEQIVKDLNNDIHIYEDNNCISLVSYFSIDDAAGAILMMKRILEQTNKVVFFVVNPND